MDMRNYCQLVAQELRLTRPEVEDVFRVMMTVAQRIIEEGDEFRLPGIGKLFCRVQKPHRHLDRFKLAQGIEHFLDVAEKKKVGFEAEPTDTQMRFKGSRKFELQLNNPPRPTSIK